MKIFRFRVLLDNSSDVFRDLEIKSDASYQDFNDLIVSSMGFSGLEMASFYMSNEEWDKGEEIVLMDVASDPGEEKVKTMADTKLSEMLTKLGEKMLYVYDFLNMKIFYVEMIGQGAALEGTEYPRVTLAVGSPPLDVNSDLKFTSYREDEEDSEFEDSYDFDDDQEFISTDDLDDY